MKIESPAIYKDIRLKSFYPLIKVEKFNLWITDANRTSLLSNGTVLRAGNMKLLYNNIHILS